MGHAASLEMAFRLAIREILIYNKENPVWMDRDNPNCLVNYFV